MLFGKQKKRMESRTEDYKLIYKLIENDNGSFQINEHSNCEDRVINRGLTKHEAYAIFMRKSRKHNMLAKVTK